MKKEIEIEETKKDLRKKIERIKRNRNIERGVIFVGAIIAGVTVTVIIKKISGERLAFKFELDEARDIIVDKDLEIGWLKEAAGWIEDRNMFD